MKKTDAYEYHGSYASKLTTNTVKKHMIINVLFVSNTILDTLGKNQQNTNGGNDKIFNLQLCSLEFSLIPISKSNILLYTILKTLRKI